MNQLVIGAALPFLAGVVIRAAKQRRPVSLVFLTVWPACMLAGSFWAVIPDIPRLLGRQDIYIKWMNDPRTDIFFFHYTIDRMESDSPWWIAVFLTMAATVWLTAWFELRRREQS